ncbi:MAG: phage capsid protein [Phycisphaerae bacterium]|nr:phage capsid protein [Phycisphaerae bacterium]
MSLQIPIAYVDQFKANILMLSQQKQTLLRGCCRPESVTGDTMYVERLGPKDAVLRGTRHGETPVSDAEHTRRKLSMADYIVPADLIDKPDKLKMLIDPQSAYTQNQVFSLNRAIDDVIITALGGPAYGGHTGGTTINNYDVGECRLISSAGGLVAAGSNHTDVTATGLTIDKLLLCKQTLDDAEIDESRQRYFLTNPYNLNQLLNTTEVKSADYNTVRALAQGQIDTFMGFKFLKSTRLPADGTDTGATNSYAFVQDAIVLAVAEEPSVSVSVRNDLCDSIQVFSTLSIGATRVEGPAVIEINLSTSGSA